MKIVYRGKNKFRFNCAEKPRIKKVKNFINNLIKHERIKTTFWRALKIQPTVDKMIKEGIDGIKNENY